MKVISAFAGLGGAELALKRAGIQADIYAYEIDKYAEAVNRYNNPNSIFLGDITQWKEHTEQIGQVDLIVGGSPCQDLSCAGKCAGLQGARSGLFYTFLEMIKYYKPKYFILENVASMSNANRNIITELMGVEPVMLNAALVSAQQRKRYFWTNIPTSELEDKGIVVKDILESGVVGQDKTYCITATYCYAKPVNLLRNERTQVFEKADEWQSKKEKLNTITASYNNHLFFNNRPFLFKKINSSEPIRIGNTGNSKAQGNRVYSIKGKTVNINANGGGGGAKTGLYAVPKNKPNLLGYKGECKSQSQKIYGTDAKTPTITRAKGDASTTGLYKVDLPDGDYIIRKLTPVEVERAFTIPDNYTRYGKFADGSIKEISNTQRYKMLGNGFVIDVIVEGILKNIGQVKNRINYHTIEDYLSE